MSPESRLLSVRDHARDSAGLEYVYPVVSRRAGGVSVGINLNPNNACNWRCVYCQVPDLSRGGPPPIDLARLERELTTMLEAIVAGDYLESHVPAEYRRLSDVAISGNGEPTSAGAFSAAVGLAADALAAHGLAGRVPLRVITNGSLMDREKVQQGIRRVAQAGGEVWFKVDTLTEAGLRRKNSTRTSPEAVLRRLACCAALCPTWVQSCFFTMDGVAPATTELDAYVAGLAPLAARLAGVHLYGLARPSLQPEAPRLGQLSAAWFEALAGRLQGVGLKVQISL